jgi:hypothetical protein
MVVVTGIVVGKTKIIPYSARLHLQEYDPHGPLSGENVKYEVPTYKIEIEGGGSYAAIRFGVVNRGILPPPQSMKCDSGIVTPSVCYPTWVPGYCPHSFRPGIRKGAWRLFPAKNFYIHEGADAALGMVGGTLGCVEILNGKWGQFLAEIERRANPTVKPFQNTTRESEQFDQTFGAQHKLVVRIEHADTPIAILAPPVSMVNTVEVRG